MFKHLAIGVLALAAALPSAAATPRKTLGDLVREGRREAVMAAITPPQIDVNEKAPDGSTALMWAVFNVDHEMVHALLKAGARANVANNYGASALTEAIKVNDLELVRLLLDAGADVDSPNLDGQTALMLAISVGSPQIARLLIARGADVNALEQFRSQNALMWAAGGNMPEIVELLLAKGAKNVDLRAKYDDWPRQQTSEPRAQYQSRQTGGLTALLYATRSGCLRCAVALVKAGADVNKPNPDGVTPLINALDNRRFDVAMFLLDKGANPHVWDMSGRTPLYLAVDMNSFRGGGGFGGGPGGGVNAGGIGGVVGGPGAPQGPPPAQREPGPQPLDVARRLIDTGVDVNHQLTRKRPYGPGRGRFADYDMRGGVGALFVATLSHDHEAMQLLLAHGAEVDLPNVFQMTPLMIAAGMRGTGRAGGGGGGPGGGDPQARAIRSIDLLLDAGANINTRVTDSRTHTAVLMAYVAGRDQEGRTALFAAAEGGMDKVVKHLLERGADPSIRDAAGKTALDIARAPAPAGAGGGAAGPSPAASGRAAVVTLLEAVTPKAPAGGDTISAR